MSSFKNAEPELDDVATSVMDNTSAYVITTVVLIGVAMAVYYYYVYDKEEEDAENDEKEEVTKFPSIDPRDFTLEELREFDGKNGAPLCVSVNHVVYDVSEGAGFYGPGGPYEMLAGRDGSRALAKMSLDPSDVKDTWDDLSDLTPFQQDSLLDWIMKFDMRYKKVGKLLKERVSDDPKKTE